MDYGEFNDKKCSIPKVWVIRRESEITFVTVTDMGCLGFKKHMERLPGKYVVEKSESKKKSKLKMALRVKTVYFPCSGVVSQFCLQSDWVAGRRDHLSLLQTDFNLLQCYAPPK